jgi:hypothetical protein
MTAETGALHSGAVVYMYAFDVAYDMRRPPPRELLGQPVAEFAIDASKRSPRQFIFYRPGMARLPPAERKGPRGTVSVERRIKLLPIGALSITVEVPFAGETLDGLLAYHDLAFAERRVDHEVHELAERACRELAPALVRPVARLAPAEPYTVFCIATPFGREGGAGAWLAAHRAEVAALLTQEPQPGRLSPQEVEESLSRRLSYYDHDLLVLDWDAALLVDEPQSFGESLYVLELANLQLAELEAYDRLLDDALERAYRDLRHGAGRSRGGVLRDLREIRIDLARFDDDLSNITKFFGDWHLARIYQGVSARFHLADWHRSLDRKLRTLDGLYELLTHDRTNRWMLLLEATIVLLFVIDLVILVTGWSG